MSAYQIFEFVVIALIVCASANRVMRQYAPASHRKLRTWAAGLVGIKLADAVVEAKGCGSGCGTCETGCSTGTAGSNKTSETPGEQPLHFHAPKH